MRNEKGSIAVVGIVIVAIIVGIGLYFVGKYNSFVTKEEQINSSWAQIENQLQRRFDLIPNLVETVKGYATHEEQIFADLAEARAQYGNANSVDDISEANDELSGALSRLLMIVENYPDLKANEQFTRLMDELAGTENRLAVARMDYNNAVQDYNGAVKRMPGNLIAGMFGFEQKDYFEVDEGVEELPSINFGG